MSSSSSFFILASLSLIILVSSLFTKAAAVRTILNGRIHFSPPTNNPVYIPGGDGLLLPKGIARSPGENAFSSRSYIPRGSLGNNPIILSLGGNAVSSRSYISTGDGLMLPRGSLGNDGLMLPKGSLGNDPPFARSAVSSRSYIPGGDGLMLPRGMARSPGGNAVSIPVGRFMLHKRSLIGYIPILRDDMLAASRLPSPLPPSAYVVESEPPPKPRPPSCYTRC